MQPSINSKLPALGTTIFTTMSRMAQQYNAINLSQGFPDFDPPPALLDALSRHLRQGHNQYAPMQGLEALREQIAKQIQARYGRQLDIEGEITVVPGATAGLFCAIHTVVEPGDEVIVFDPCYDSYEPAVTLAGGRCIHIPLQEPAYTIDWQRTADAINPRTRLVIINSPHNPGGSVLSEQDLLQLQALLANTRALVLSDEVYEHLVFDGKSHQSVLQFDDLYQRSFAVFSFGKTFHATGWKTGYCIAPPALMTEFRKIHQYMTFVAVTPIQHALADFMAIDNQFLAQLPGFYQRKRDLFCAGLGQSRFSFRPSAGSYFQLANYEEISDIPDQAFCEYLVREVGVAAIPVQPFNKQATNSHTIRFCFAKSEHTLNQALERLCEI